MPVRPPAAASIRPGDWINSYLKRSEFPLHSLVFLLPAMVLFELALPFHPADPIAFRMLQIFFRQLGSYRPIHAALSSWRYC